MKKLLLIFRVMLLTAPALAIMNGFVQPGVGVSDRHLSNGVGWQNEAGIGLYDTINDLYGVITTDKVVGLSWGLTGGSPAGSYWTGEAYLDHLPITNPNYISSGCAPGPQFAYTSDPCTWGLSAEDVPWQTFYGSGGPDPYLTDTSLVYMSAYPLFHDGAESTLVFQPMGISGNSLSNQMPNPPIGEILSYYNNSTGTIDLGTVANNSKTVFTYDGPNPINCDQYNDCEWQQPSAFTSNYGAPVQGSPFWTWGDPNGNGYGPLRNSTNFINNNGQYLTGAMQVNVGSSNAASVFGGSMFTQNGTHAVVGHVLGKANQQGTQLIVTHMSTDIFLLNWRCNGFDLCGQKQYFNWGIAGANSSGTGLSPAYQVNEALPTIGLEMPTIEPPKLPTMNELAKPQPGEVPPDLQASINAEEARQPDIHRLAALMHPGQIISPVGVSLDKDGVVRWHVGVVDLNHGFPYHVGVQPSAAMKMSVTREFKSNGATAPVVVEPGYIVMTGDQVSK